MNQMRTPPQPLPRLRGLLEILPLSLDQYHRMIAAGILEEGAPIEFLEGYLVAKDLGRGQGMSHSPAHVWSVGEVRDQLFVALGSQYVVRSQVPVRLGQPNQPGAASEPEPDGSVVDGPKSRYAGRLPGPGEIRLLVEVADTSLHADRNYKGWLYASNNIPLYWIVNLVDRCLEIYTNPDPAAGQYRSQQVLAEDQQVVLAWSGLTPLTFTVRDFLP